MPPIDEQKVRYGSLAASHLNVAFKIMKAGCASASPAGDFRSTLDEYTALRYAVLNGHKWWILPESLEPELNIEISLWRNADQNDNQGTHEIELLQTVMTTATERQKTENEVYLGDLVGQGS